MTRYVLRDPHLPGDGGKPQVVLAEVDAHGGGEVAHPALLALALLILAEVGALRQLPLAF